MKKIYFIILFLSIVSVLSLPGCGGNDNLESRASSGVISGADHYTSAAGLKFDPDNALEITAAAYYPTIINMLLDGSQYIDKSVRLRGMYGKWTFQGQDYHSIYRWFWAECQCCWEAQVALDFVWEEEVQLSMGDWIEIEGVFDEYVDNQGYTNYRIIVTKLTTLDYPGIEVVHKEFRTEYDSFTFEYAGKSTY